MQSTLEEFRTLMKHSEWLRLKAEGEHICAILRQQGYRCTKQTRRLPWKVTLESKSYVLTWLPAPVGDWSVIPRDDTSEQQQLMSSVQKALKNNERITSQHILATENLDRPWAIVRILPDARHYTVARFFNRQDADDHLRVLQRFIPTAEFEIIFAPPDEKEQSATL